MLTKALILFCERARSIKPLVPITVESVSAQANNIAVKLLEAYERNTTISRVAGSSRPSWS